MKRFRMIAAVSLAVLIACGGGSGTDKNTVTIVPAGVIKAAFAKAVEAKSARLAMTMDIQSPNGGGTVTGSGVMALNRALGAISLDFSGVPDSPFEGNLEMRIVGQVMYMKVPTLDASGKPWLKIDFKALSKLSGVDLSQLTQLQNQDPAQTLRYLAAVSGDVRKLGSDTVRGVKTTRYAATIDLTKALANLPEGARAGLQKIYDKAGISSLPVEVWISADGLLRKMSMTMDLSKAAGVGTGNIKIAIELYDYGTPVNVSAPPAGQVADFAEVLGKM